MQHSFVIYSVAYYDISRISSGYLLHRRCSIYLLCVGILRFNFQFHPLLVFYSVAYIESFVLWSLWGSALVYKAYFGGCLVWEDLDPWFSHLRRALLGSSRFPGFHFCLWLWFEAGIYSSAPFSGIRIFVETQLLFWSWTCCQYVWGDQSPGVGTSTSTVCSSAPPTDFLLSRHGSVWV